MGTLAILALRIVLTMVLAGSLVVQGATASVLFADGNGDGSLSRIRVPIVLVVVLGILAAQVVVVCVWRLLTLVRRGTVFSDASFRYVDVVIGAAAAASLLAFALGVLLAPGEAVAPGIVLLIGGLATVLAGVALLVLVMRTLLAQAVAREAEAHHLRAELDEVI